MSIDKARRLFDDERFAEARDEIERMQPDNGQEEGALLLLLLCYAELGDHGAAERVARECLTLNPEQASAHSGLGSALDEQGKLKESLIAYDAAIALKPTAARYVLRGTVHCRLNQVSEGLNDYQRAIELEPDFSEGHLNLGIELGLEDDHRARLHLEKAHELDPLEPLAVRELGALEYRDGELETAQGLFERALELDPNDTWTKLFLAGVHEDRGRPDQAVEVLTSAHRSGQLISVVAGRLGRTLLRLGHEESAKTYLREALEHDPSDAIASFHLAELLLPHRDLERTEEDDAEIQNLLSVCARSDNSRYATKARALLEELRLGLSQD